jgi:hypothetical protein
MTSRQYFTSEVHRGQDDLDARGLVDSGLVLLG